MAFGCFSPSWFVGIDMGLEFFFFLASGIIALFSYQVYRRSSYSPAGIFSLSFGLISLSYLLHVLVNFNLIKHTHTKLCIEKTLHSLPFFELPLLVAYLTLSIISLALLLYISLKISDKRLMFLLILLPLLLTVVSQSLMVFFICCIIYLLFASWHFICNYSQTKQTNALLIAISFGLISLGWLELFLSPFYPMLYVVGHMFELVAFSLLLYTTWRMKKR